MKCSFASLGGLCFLIALPVIGCGNKEEGKAAYFELSPPIDLMEISNVFSARERDQFDLLEAYMFGDERERLQDGCVSFGEEASFLHFPEYAETEQPFLATAEDYFNATAMVHNIWSDNELWYRGHEFDLLCEDSDIVRDIQHFDTEVIHNANIRTALQQYKDTILYLMTMEPEEWDEGVKLWDIFRQPLDAIVGNTYKFFGEDDEFTDSLIVVIDLAESMVKDRFANYQNAGERQQLKVMLDELQACQNFDEQCALWCSWANCEKSPSDDEWIMAVGLALMNSGYYSPMLGRIWMTWRAICQPLYFGSSRDSAIPNYFYNRLRRNCYSTCLKRIERCPDDVFAMDCAASIGGRNNLSRYGQMFGNGAMQEQILMMPNRYESLFDDEDDLSDDEESVGEGSSLEGETVN